MVSGRRLQYEVLSYATTSKRASRNFISGLRDGQGVIQTEGFDMGQIVVDYFHKIFSSRVSTEEEINDVVETTSSKVDQAIDQIWLVYSLPLM